MNPLPKQRYSDAREIMARIDPAGLIEVVDRLRESNKYEQATIPRYRNR